MVVNLSKEIKSLEQRAYEVIKEMILTGKLKPNVRLVEEKMAADLGVSRTTVKKAFIRLKNEYLLEGEPSKGVHVKLPSLEEANEAYDVRAALEGLAAKIAVKTLDRKKLSEMIRKFEKLKSSDFDGQSVEFQNLNYDFHMMLAGCYKNRSMTKMIATLIMQTKAFHQARQVKYFYAEGSEQEHLDILYAIRDRDEELAETLTTKHLLNIRQAFIDIIKNSSASENMSG